MAKVLQWLAMCLAALVLAIVKVGVGWCEGFEATCRKKAKFYKKKSLQVKFADSVVEPGAAKKCRPEESVGRFEAALAAHAVNADLVRFFGEGREKTKSEVDFYATFEKLEEKKNRSFPYAVVEQNRFWKKWKLKQKVDGVH